MVCSVPKTGHCKFTQCIPFFTVVFGSCFICSLLHSPLQTGLCIGQNQLICFHIFFCVGCIFPSHIKISAKNNDLLICGSNILNDRQQQIVEYLCHCLLYHISILSLYSHQNNEIPFSNILLFLLSPFHI